MLRIKKKVNLKTIKTLGKKDKAKSFSFKSKLVGLEMIKKIESFVFY